MSTYGEQMIKREEELAEMKTFVREKFPNIDFPDPVREPLWFGKMKREPVEGKYAVINGADRNQVFNIVSDQYKIVPHEEVIFKTLQTLEKFEEYGEPKIKIKMVNNASRMILETVFPEVKDNVKTKDAINPRFVLKNSYDSLWKLKTMFGAFRLVCSNGMTIGKVYNQSSNRHIESLEIENLFNTLEVGMESYSTNQKLWSHWAETKLNLDTYIKVAKELPFSETEIEKIEKAPLMGEDVSFGKKKENKDATVWDLNNALTQYTSHDIRSDNRAVEVEEKIGRVMYRFFGNFNIQ